MPIDFKKPTPETLEEAVDRIVEGLADTERDMVKKYGAGSQHHGVGTSIRNHWGLWTGSALKTHFMTTYGLGHADDMSGLILFGVDAKVTGNPFDVKKEVARYKEYWINMMLDPLTLMKIVGPVGAETEIAS